MRSPLRLCLTVVCLSASFLASAQGGAQTVFVRGVDGAAWMKDGDGAWMSLGGRLGGAPDACISGGSAVIVARGAGNDVVTNRRTGSAWSGWRSLGGTVTSDVSVVCTPDGEARVFARGQDLAIWTRGTDDANAAWSSLGGQLDGGPDAAIAPSGIIDVVASGTDNAVWHNAWDGRAWTGWRSLGGQTAGDPTIARMGAERAEVVIRHTDGSVHHGTLRPGAAVSWQAIPSGVVRGSPDAAPAGGGRLLVVARGTDDAPWRNTFDGTRWSGWTSLGGVMSSDPAVVDESAQISSGAVVTAVAAGGGTGTVSTLPPGPTLAVPASLALPVPPGYGHYCSMSWERGGFALAFSGADPCADLARSAAGGRIERAGLYALDGPNNVLLRCGGFTNARKGTGQAPIQAAYAESAGRSGCVFVVSPQDLPIFVRPYQPAPGDDPDADVVQTNGFDYAQFGRRLDSSLFAGGTTEAAIIDHLGRPRTAGQDNHEGHDFAMPLGRPIRAVARGRVFAVRQRPTPFANCTSPQPEIYIAHDVGFGEYQERFVSYYAHMDTMSVTTGASVDAGQVIGTAGTKGCSSGPHLHLSVTRLTNLTGSRTHDFRLLESGRGDNGMPGRVDPYGWQAPRQVDPMAWMYLGDYEDNGLRLRNPGAFSINLWKPNEAPRAIW